MLGPEAPPSISVYLQRVHEAIQIHRKSLSLFLIILFSTFSKFLLLFFDSRRGAFHSHSIPFFMLFGIGIGIGAISLLPEEPQQKIKKTYLEFVLV